MNNVKPGPLSQPPRVSPALLKVFNAYNRRYLRRHFHSLRILQAGLPQTPAQPIVVYLNHSSWWDPLVCLLLSLYFFTNRVSFGPIDAAMLERYRFFRRLGFFGVDQCNGHRAAAFLRTSRAILASSRNMIWLTPQGNFVDVRTRPLDLQPGLGALATRTRGVAFVPLAIEYSFWTESRPEILVSFGEPLVPSIEIPRSASEWTQLFSEKLEATENELAIRSCQRRSDEWITLNSGRSGVNAAYDAWRWLRAKVRGQNFTPEHQPQSLSK